MRCVAIVLVVISGYLLLDFPQTFHTSTMQKPRVFAAFQTKTSQLTPKLNNHKTRKAWYLRHFRKNATTKQEQRTLENETPKRRVVDENLAKHRVFVLSTKKPHKHKRHTPRGGRRTCFLVVVGGGGGCPCSCYSIHLIVLIVLVVVVVGIGALVFIVRLQFFVFAMSEILGTCGVSVPSGAEYIEIYDVSSVFVSCVCNSWSLRLPETSVYPALPCIWAEGGVGVGGTVPSSNCLRKTSFALSFVFLWLTAMW